MENKLFKLFDYQKFSKNKDLQKIIDDVEERYQNEYVLSDDSLAFAAGGKKSEEDFLREKAIKEKEDSKN